jgi:hypothetical protein
MQGFCGDFNTRIHGYECHGRFDWIEYGFMPLNWSKCLACGDARWCSEDAVHDFTCKSCECSYKGGWDFTQRFFLDTLGSWQMMTNALGILPQPIFEVVYEEFPPYASFLRWRELMKPEDHPNLACEESGDCLPTDVSDAETLWTSLLTAGAEIGVAGARSFTPQTLTSPKCTKPNSFRLQNAAHSSTQRQTDNQDHDEEDRPDPEAGSRLLRVLLRKLSSRRRTRGIQGRLRGERVAKSAGR